MAAKVKIYGKIYFIDSGFWYCNEDPESAKSFQDYCDLYFKISQDYLVDIDEQSARLAEKEFAAEIISIKKPVFDENVIY